MRAELVATARANARTRFDSAWSALMLPRMKRKPSEWAEQVRKMPVGGPISGGQVVRYSHRFMPHCVEQMDSADDPSVRMIVIWAGVRDGKTNGVGLNIIGRTVTDDPGGIYCIQPTEADVEKFNADDLEPMIQLSLEEYFVQKKSRDSGRTKDFKKFRGGSIRIPSAGSITAFRGSTVKMLLISEADALVIESIYKAIGRTQGLADAVIVMESTGTYAPTEGPNGEKIYNSVIHQHYEKGDMRKWFVACEECGALQWIKYAQIKYPPGRMEEAAYHCEQCDHTHDERAWRRMCAEGKWYPTAGLTDEELTDIAANWQHAKAKQPEIRSYWRNGFNSLLPKSKGYASKLHQFVAEGEAAKASPAALKTWTNEIAAELWNPAGSEEAPPAWKPIFDGRENYGLTVPRKGLFLAAMVDCQLNRLEVEWRAFGRREESWGMDHVTLDGAVRHSEVWQKLRKELSRKFRWEGGGEISLGFGFIDGGHYAEDVYRFMQELARNPVPGVSGKVRASKGIGQAGHPLIDPSYKTVAKNLKGHHIGTWEAKDRIYERLRMTGESDDREGRMHYNERYTEEAIQQLCVETVTVSIERGQEVRKYLNPLSKRNELLDLEVGCLAAVRLRPRNWDALEEELLANAAPPERRAPAAPVAAVQSWATAGMRW